MFATADENEEKNADTSKSGCMIFLWLQLLPHHFV